MSTPSENSDKGYKQVTSQKRNMHLYMWKAGRPY